MVNQVKIRLAVNELIGASSVRYFNYPTQEIFKFSTRNKGYRIIRYADDPIWKVSSEWYDAKKGWQFAKFQFKDIDEVLEFIRGLK